MKRSRANALFGQYVRFCIVGAAGLAVDMAALALMVGWGQGIVLSKVTAAELAILNNFLWNDRWTFARHVSGKRPAFSTQLFKFFKFNLICAFGIFLSVALLRFQVETLRLNIYLANFIAIVLISLWNFFLNIIIGAWGSPDRTN